MQIRVTPNGQQLQPEQIDQLRTHLIAYAFGIPVPDDEEAAEQFLRTQVHPKLYETIAHLDALLRDGGIDFIRRVAEGVGYSSVSRVFPHTDSLVRTYQAEQHNPTLLAHTFRELICLAAFFNEDILERLFATIYGTKMTRTLQSHFTGQSPYTEAMNWNTFSQQHKAMQRLSLADRITTGDPKRTIRLQPTHVSVRENNEMHDYTVSSHIRLFDAVHRCYDMHIDEPERRQRFAIDRHISIPTNRIRDGVYIEMVLHDKQGVAHEPERLFLSNDELSLLQSKGSAIQSCIGRGAEFPLYSEYFTPPLPGEPHILPKHPLVSLRAAAAAIEVKKLDPTVKLTVFV